MTALVAVGLLKSGRDKSALLACGLVNAILSSPKVEHASCCRVEDDLEVLEGARFKLWSAPASQPSIQLTRLTYVVRV